MIKCEQCGKEFKSRKGLKIHRGKVHGDQVKQKEIELLKKGYIPKKTKIGKKFKGENEIIIG